MGELFEQYDYAVIGGGTVGCVVAAQLAADGQARVLLVESGGAGKNPLVGVPGANVVTGTMPKLNWSYETELVPALGGRRLYWTQGRVLGGSGEINGMIPTG